MTRLIISTSIEILTWVSIGSTGQIYFDSWAMGRRYTSITGIQDSGDNDGFVTGFLSPQRTKPVALLDSNGNIFEKSKPQYESVGASGFVVVTDYGIANDGTGDQSAAINALLENAVGTPVFFPAGVYQVQSTVKVPANSKIVGEGWPQVRPPAFWCFGLETNIRVLDYGHWIVL
jgi:glucan 1,3-beta-glucosidase